jgi:hypothetical protein
VQRVYRAVVLPLARLILAEFADELLDL